MKYGEIELKEFKSDKPITFSPPRPMLVWDIESTGPVKRDVLLYHPRYIFPVISFDDSYRHCAEIPEEPKPRRATNRELAKWLAQGNGEWKNAMDGYPCRRTDLGYSEDTKPVPFVLVRKWDDEEWHEPTADYMGLEA